MGRHAGRPRSRVDAGDGRVPQAWSDEGCIARTGIGTRQRPGLRRVPDQSTKLKPLEIADILRCLPHRYPFLMVDRIIDIRGDEYGIGIKNVTVNEPHFQGHFPGQSGDAGRPA